MRPQCAEASQFDPDGSRRNLGRLDDSDDPSSPGLDSVWRMVGRPGTEMSIWWLGRLGVRRAPRPCGRSPRRSPTAPGGRWRAPARSRRPWPPRPRRPGRRSARAARRPPCRLHAAPRSGCRAPCGPGAGRADGTRSGRTAHPRSQAACRPLPRSITATGVRSVTSMWTVCGQLRDTSTRRTEEIDSTRARMASRSTRAKGVPVGTSAARSHARLPDRLGAGDLDAASRDVAGEEHQPHRAGQGSDQEQREHDPAHPTPATGVTSLAEVRAGDPDGLLVGTGRRRRSLAAPAPKHRHHRVTPAPRAARAPPDREGSRRLPRASARRHRDARDRRDAAAVADHEGSKTTCSGSRGTASATMAPLTPGSGSSRAT